VNIFSKLFSIFNKNENSTNIDEADNSTLLQASISGSTENVKLLIEKGADINMADKDGDTPLIKASEKGHKEIAKILIEKGVDPNAVTNKFGRTALIKASIYGQIEVVKLLIEKGAEINADDKDGNTALVWASKKGHKNISELLIKEGADVNYVNKVAKTQPENEQSSEGARWYFSTDDERNFTQIVIEVPINERVDSSLASLILSEKYINMVTSTWVVGFFRVDDNPAPRLLIRVHDRLESIIDGRCQIAFTFFRTPSGGILGIYIYFDSDQLRTKLSQSHVFIEIFHGLDVQNFIELVRAGLQQRILTCVLATNSEMMRIEANGESYAAPHCRFDIPLQIDPHCTEALVYEFDNLLKYHNDRAGTQDYQQSVNYLWQIIPEGANPILPDPKLR